MTTKPALTLVTDPELIALIRRENETGDSSLPRGAQYGGAWYAYAQDVRNWRRSGHRNPLE